MSDDKPTDQDTKMQNFAEKLNMVVTRLSQESMNKLTQAENRVEGEIKHSERSHENDPEERKSPPPPQKKKKKVER